MPSQVSRGVAGRVAKIGFEVQKANKTSVTRAAFVAKDMIQHEIKRVAPSGRLRNVGSSPGAKIGVRYDVKGTKNPTALVRAIGPLHLLENPISPHVIIPKKVGRGAKGRGSRRENKQALYDALFGGTYAGQKPMRTPYGPRFRVEHPGVQNQPRPWAKGVQRARPMVKREVDRTYVNAFKRGATR